MRTIIQEFQNLWDVDEKPESRGDKRGNMTKTKEKSASNTNMWVVGGSSSVGMLFRELQNLWKEDERFASRGDMMGKITNIEEKMAGGGDGITLPVDDSGCAPPDQTNEGGDMTRAVDGGGDVHAQAPIDDGGDDVTGDANGNAAESKLMRVVTWPRLLTVELLSKS